MLVLEDRLVAHFPVARGQGEQTPRGVFQNAMREVRADMQKHERCECIGCIPLTAANREPELAYSRVAKFMGERDQPIADDELDQLLALLWVERRNRGV